MRCCRRTGPALWCRARPAAAGPDELKQFRRAFNGLCGSCHGLNAVSGGVVPDLRYLMPEKQTADWLRETLDADRADGGYGGYVDAAGHARHYVALAEAQRPALPMPAVIGRRFDARDTGLRAVWAGQGHSALPEVGQAAMLTAPMRQNLQALGTAAKFAVPLRDRRRPVGILCADWHEVAPRWEAPVCEDVISLAHAALGPLLLAASQLARDDALPALPNGALPTAAPERSDDEPPPAVAIAGWDTLTPAEQRVAHLVANGLSYREIARTLDRSLSTVDHQLRSLRDKLGVRSTARLVHLLSNPTPHAGQVSLKKRRTDGLQGERQRRDDRHVIGASPRR